MLSAFLNPIGDLRAGRPRSWPVIELTYGNGGNGVFANGEGVPGGTFGSFPKAG